MPEHLREGEKLFAASATVRVKIIALNGSLEASEGPEGEIVVP